MGHSKEVLTLMIREGKDHYEFGDPFTFTALILIDGGVAHIKGANGPLPSRKDIQLFCEDLKKLYGVKTLKWERLKNGEVKSVVTSKI